MDEPAPASLSVLVTSYDSPAVLRLCLRSLASQRKVAQIVVADCSPQDPADELAEEFPEVRFLHWARKKRVPDLRWAALEHVGGAIVGALEARCTPAADWARTILAEHAAFPEAPAVGGTVALGSGATAFEMGLYLCEYGAFAPPLAPGPAKALSGANLSYKRSALEENRDLLEAGAWETFLHERWLAQGRPLWLCDARVEFRNTMKPGAALRQRYHYGRGYAAERVRYQAGSKRYLYAALSPALPLLLTVRMARRAFSKDLAGWFLRASGWVLALNVAWSAGEAAGYLLGADPEPRIF